MSERIIYGAFPEVDPTTGAFTSFTINQRGERVGNFFMKPVSTEILSKFATELKEEEKMKKEIPVTERIASFIVRIFS